MDWHEVQPKQALCPSGTQPSHRAKPRAARTDYVAALLLASSVIGPASVASAAPTDDWRVMVDACAAFMEAEVFKEPDNITLVERRDLGEDHILCFDSFDGFDLEALPVPGCNVVEATFEGRSDAQLDLKWRDYPVGSDSWEKATCSPLSTSMEFRRGIPDELASWFVEAEASGRVVAVKDHVWAGCSQNGREWRVVHAHKFGPILLFTSLKTPCNP